jgi:hypothetical protein
MTGELMIRSKRLCRRCSSPQLIVRSRKNGFVTQNCERCGNNAWISLHEIPPFTCASCQKPIAPRILGRKNNYAYYCFKCGVIVWLWELVPWWHERFEYRGIATPNEIRN